MIRIQLLLAAALYPAIFAHIAHNIPVGLYGLSSPPSSQNNTQGDVLQFALFPKVGAALYLASPLTRLFRIVPDAVGSSWSAYCTAGDFDPGLCVLYCH
jgi:hypothetical protein